jgi:hypothetical protein
VTGLASITLTLFLAKVSYTMRKVFVRSLLILLINFKVYNKKILRFYSAGGWTVLVKLYDWELSDPWV